MCTALGEGKHCSLTDTWVLEACIVCRGVSLFTETPRRLPGTLSFISVLAGNAVSTPSQTSQKCAGHLQNICKLHSIAISERELLRRSKACCKYAKNKYLKLGKMFCVLKVYSQVSTVAEFE